MDIQTLKELAPYIGGIATFLGAWYKDRIANALNMQSKKKDIEVTTADILDKNLEAYQKMFDGYVERKELEDQRQVLRIGELEKKIDCFQAEKELLRKEKVKKESEVLKLREEIHEIKIMLDKALKQLEFYKKNSDIVLPKELQ